MTDERIRKWAGKWALVTGASSGIGTALASELAAAGTNVVLTARRAERLQELASRLATTDKVRAEVFGADLERPGARDALFAFTRQRGIEIDLLANNAGFGIYGEFASAELSRLL